MEQTHIAELLRPFLHHPVSATQLTQLATYLELLLKWNARMNLTAVREPESIVRRHFGESLFAAERLVQNDGGTEAIDVGSGAGFPGIPLALFAPGMQVSLVESHGKKATFLKEVLRALSLHNAHVQNCRLQDLDIDAHLVTIRAVERFAAVLPLAATRVRPLGRIALLIGADQTLPAIRLVSDFHWSDPVAVPESESRILLVGRAPA